MKNQPLEYWFFAKKFDIPIQKKVELRKKIGYLFPNLSLILNGNQGIQTREYLVEQNLKKVHSKLKGSEIAQIYSQASQFKNRLSCWDSWNLMKLLTLSSSFMNHN